MSLGPFCFFPRTILFCPLDHFVLSLGQLFSQESYIPAKVQKIMLFSFFIVVVLPVNKKMHSVKKILQHPHFFFSVCNGSIHSAVAGMYRGAGVLKNTRVPIQQKMHGSWNIQGGRDPEKYARPNSANARPLNSTGGQGSALRDFFFRPSPATAVVITAVATSRPSLYAAVAIQTNKKRGA